MRAIGGLARCHRAAGARRQLGAHASMPAAALDELEKDRSVRGVVIASGLKKDIFTAGCVVPSRGAAHGADCAAQQRHHGAVQQGDDGGAVHALLARADALPGA